MVKSNLKTALLFFLNMISLAVTGYGQADNDEKHKLVSMRMIGHEIMLNSGDSSSLILPIEKEANRYKIKFQSAFQFNPEELVTTIDSVVKQTNIAQRYIVEVEQCETKEVIYSYEIGGVVNTDIIPCGARVPEKACYTVFITILNATAPDMATGLSSGKKQGSFLIIGLLIIILIIAGFFIYRKKKQNPVIEPANPDMIAIGEYRFDTIHSELLIANNKVELSSKESELLLLLYNAANTTVEREVILKNVWGDEGDYIGRTLDVFISKLRKKLERDTNVKIVNSRGAGYKLVVNLAG